MVGGLNNGDSSDHCGDSGGGSVDSGDDCVDESGSTSLSSDVWG